MHITSEAISQSDFAGAGADPACGATAIFFGTVRNSSLGRRVQKIYYECYAPMAEKEIAKLVACFRQERGVRDIRVLHRTGMIAPGAVAVAIEVTAGHRQEAFRVAEEVLEEIKHKVPIWKKEYFEDGTAEWTPPGSYPGAKQCA